MTCSSLSTTGQRNSTSESNALEKGPFDPGARQYGSDGISYVDFHAALNGEPDPQDPCNAEISRLAKQGRSEAFCREYRKGYDAKLAEVRGQSLAFQARRGDFTSAKGAQQAVECWEPGYSDRQAIHQAAERHAEVALCLGTAARAAGVLDAIFAV